MKNNDENVREIKLWKEEENRMSYIHLECCAVTTGVYH